MIAVFITRQTSPIGAIRIANAIHDQEEDCPIRIFCGLPVIVITEPTLLLVARPNRYGSARNPARFVAVKRSGVIRRQIVSLINSAERMPATMQTTQRSCLSLWLRLSNRSANAFSSSEAVA